MLLVGLGNPTKDYENTYHNIGFLAIDRLLQKLNKKATKEECSALTYVFSKNNENIIIAKPLTYMNLSGQAVKGLAKKYNQADEDIIIFYDDIDLPPFHFRVREKGSGGTHNGMKNIVLLMSTESIKRVRIGIGNPKLGNLADYVLSKIDREKLDFYNAEIDKMADLLIAYINNKDFTKFMRDVNNLCV